MRAGPPPKPLAIGVLVVMLYGLCLRQYLIADVIPPYPDEPWMKSPLRLPFQATSMDSRLAMLLTPSPPLLWTTRDEIMLQLAHAVLWQANASLKGGFVRDWLVRGERANDLDVGLSVHDQSVATVAEAVDAYLIRSESARARRVRITSRRQRTYALALTVEAAAMSPIHIDIRDPRIVYRGQPVDADVSNLAISRPRGLHLRVDVVGHSVDATLTHVRKKQFVFFEQFGSGIAALDGHVVERLRKYLGRGWTCLSMVPTFVVETLPERERRLLSAQSLMGKTA